MQKLEINTVALGMKIDVKLLVLIWGLLISLDLLLNLYCLRLSIQDTDKIITETSPASNSRRKEKTVRVKPIRSVYPVREMRHLTV
jgi:hypothetical protein